MAARQWRVFYRLGNRPAPETTFVPLFGVSSPSVSDWTAKQTTYTPAVTRYFFSGALKWNDSYLVNFRANAPARQALYTSWKTYSQTDLDTFLLNAGADSDRLYFLTFHHEPENDGAAYTAAQYKADNANVRKRWVACGKPANVKIVSTLMGFTYRTSTRNPEDYYIDSVVGSDGENHKVFDALFCDQYDAGYKNGGYSDFGSMNKDLVKFGIAKGLPIGFGEIGSAVGPKRVTDLVKRRKQITDSADWCLAKAGTGPGQVWVACYWDVQANGKWKPADKEHATYGPIATQDYRISLSPVLMAESPGTKAGQVAYANADTITPGLWKDYCQTSRTYHSIS